MTATAPDRENAVQIIIVLLIGGIAGAASFTHVHDWTMHNSAAGTGNWFGWANAVISELTPTAAGLEIRRRKRRHQPIAYPMTLLIAAAALSLTAQVAQARHSPTGWVVAALPALAFLALSKLVIARSGTPMPAPPAPASSEQHTPAVSTDLAREALPSELLTGARMAAFTYRQATGTDITADTLASHLAIPPDIAGRLIHALDGTTTPPEVTNINGTDLSIGSRP
jgi:hypothetical protein